MTDSQLTLRPSEIAKYFELDKCPKYIYWLSKKEELKSELSQLDEKIQNKLKGKIDKILKEQGENFELAQLDILGQITGIPKNSIIRSEKKFANLIWYILTPQFYKEKQRIFFQPHIEGQIGIYKIEGKADIILVRHLPHKVEIWIFEAKFTNQEKFHHRIQAVAYAMLIYNAVRTSIKNRDISVYVAVLTKKNNLNSAYDYLEKRGFLEEIRPNADILNELREQGCLKALKFPEETRTYIEILTQHLKKDGTFSKLIEGKEIPRFWISKRCQNCPYEALCIKEAVEEQSLGLLGILPGDQELLEEMGIKTLEDLANLYDYPEKLSPKNFEPLKPKDSEKVNAILKRLNITNLQKLSQGAYRLLREINRRAGEPDYFPDWLQGSGFNLPKDTYREEDDIIIPNYPSGSLIRTYIFVQHDPIYDRIAILSAVVENTLSNKQKVIVKIIQELSEDEDKMDMFERQLLDEFFGELFRAIKEVKPQELNLDEFFENRKPDKKPWKSPEESQKYGYVHLYFYSRFQRNSLMDAIKRHSNKLKYYKGIRWILGLRSAIDFKPREQDTVSIIQEDIKRRKALRFPGLGIIVTTAQHRIPGRGDDLWFWWDSSLTSKFENIFKIAAKKKIREDQSVHINLNRLIVASGSEFSGEIYPVINRDLEQIPLEYLWKDIKDEKGRVKLAELAKYFALAIWHLERSVPEWYKDATVRKEPIPIDDLEAQGFEEISLAEVLMEYQKLEHHTKRELMEEYYRLPLKERCSTGKSLLIKIESIEQSDRDTIIHGQALLPDGQRWNLDSAPPISLSEDSFVVVTPIIEENGELRQITKYGDPKSIQYSILATIQFFDESSGKVSIKLIQPFGIENYEFVIDGHLYVDRENKVRRLRHRDITLQEGEYLVIDEAIDDINFSRAYTVLNTLREKEDWSPLYSKLNSIYKSRRITVDNSNLMKINPPWNEEDIKEFIDTFLRGKINPKQRDFILDWNKSLVTLQGPPGTGKTSWAVSPAILGRVYSSLKQRCDILVLVTGISHRAINEALTSFVKLLIRLEAEFGSKISKDIQIYRLVNSSEQQNKIESEVKGIIATKEPVRVQFINYNTDTIPFSSPERGNTTITEYILKNDPEASVKPRALVIFGTTGAISGLSNRTNLLADLIVIDEASMMDLPMFLLATSFLKENGQVLLVGDHRQMQPIQQHDWEHEDRETIEQHTPFLSAINFIRFLRGELSESEREDFKKVLYRDPPLWEYNNLKKDILPFHRLNETYRLPQIVADMLTDLFYIHDNIELKSKKHEIEKLKEDSKKFKEGLLRYIERLEDNPDTTPIASVINPEYPVTLVLHDDNKSTKVNEVEKIIISEIVKKLPKEYTSEDKLGIVVPFKAQRAQIKSLLRQLGLEHIQVDTVERFQGGEKDIIIISLTASDPSYISAVLEFLFNPNRLNVAMSRMKEKLILIGSQEVFNATTKDIHKFEELIEPWRTLFRKIRTYGEKLWSGTLEEFVGELDTSRDRYQGILDKYKAINMEVFGINE
ncbi:AAA domain-containing protein [Thermococcus sp.]